MGTLGKQSGRNSGGAAMAKVSPTIRTHGAGKIGARSSNPSVVRYNRSSGLDTLEMMAHGVDLLSPARPRCLATVPYSPGMYTTTVVRAVTSRCQSESSFPRPR